MRDDCSGGQTSKSRGIERQAGNAVAGLVRQHLGCSSIWSLAPAPDMKGYLEGSRGTPNHRGLLRLWRYGYAQRAAGEAERAAARYWLADFLKKQFTAEGQQYGEIMTTSHPQIWAQIRSAARALSSRPLNHHRVALPGEEEIFDLAGQCYRRQLYLYRELEVKPPEVAEECVGYVLAPNSRSAGAHSDIHTVEYALLEGRPAPGRFDNPSRPMQGDPNDPDGRWWYNFYSIGVWAARRLIRDGDDLGGAAGEHHRTEPALLRNPLYIERLRPDVRFSFRHLTKSGGPILWFTGRKDGRYFDAPYFRHNAKNLDCPFEMERWPGAQFTVIQGANRPGLDEEDDELS